MKIDLHKKWARDARAVTLLAALSGLFVARAEAQQEPSGAETEAVPVAVADDAQIEEFAPPVSNPDARPGTLKAIGVTPEPKRSGSFFSGLSRLLNP